ncbi:ABC transporter permease subunit [Aquisalimonas asiatica]|uniref:L-glutamine ABC transporter membrane protein n=1 Tax=Aquisalimonas asiatica TaxID=406100 RepID=A0A1H8RYW5_9GAMM|nr:ABC transporter permease subunit [Aquisalimonas asiatica]SEO71497.1 L-glutamine ABC transporter membrane protein [Aquisalimonas asiatica]
MEFRWDVVWTAMPQMIQGAQLTAQITLLGIGGGLIIGTLCGLVMAFRIPVIHWLVFAYISVIRGTPIVVQAMFIYFALPMTLDITLSGFAAASLCLAMNAGAYITEIVRGAVISIDKGLTDAGLALGMSYPQVLMTVVGPLAFRRTIPPLGNQFIISLKDSALFLVIGVAELAQRGEQLTAQTGRALEIWTAVAVFYLIMTFTLAMIMRMIERRMTIL